MKTKLCSYSFTARTTLAAAMLAVAGLTGCSKEDRHETKTTMSDAAHTVGEKSKQAYDSTKDAFVHAWDSVKDATFDKRDDFSANAKAMSAEMDAKVSKVKADYSSEQASASRKAAVAEFKDADANYKARVSALGDATEATWDSAKQSTIAAWDKLQASYYKARAN